MVKASSVFEVEIDGERNRSLLFKPISRRVRGRFEFARVANPRAAVLAQQWPGPIPGQRIGIDLEGGKGYIFEPLHAPENEPFREKIAAMGARLAPERETFDAVDLPTWVYWLRRAVEGGVARVVQGELPTKLAGKPKKKFFSTPTEDRRDKVIETLVAVVACLLPPERRKELLNDLQAE